MKRVSETLSEMLNEVKGVTWGIGDVVEHEKKKAVIDKVAFRKDTGYTYSIVYEKGNGIAWLEPSEMKLISLCPVRIPLPR
jgi:hypothetical protein